MILACCLCIVTFVSTVNTKNDSDSLIFAMNDYAECNKAANSFREASDFLTSEIRLFAVNLDPIYMDGYFEEVATVQRREKAIEILQLSHKGDETDIYINKAFEASKSLEYEEIYSFRLICDAINYPIDLMPEPVRNIELSEEHRLLSKTQKINLTRDFLFDADYLKSKAKLLNYVDRTMSALMNSYLSVQKKNEQSLSTSVLFQHLSVILLFGVSVILFLILVIFILKPIKEFVKAIRNTKKVKYSGSYEMKYIQLAYNDLIEKNEIRTSVLKYKAEHDKLTGLINREAFEQIKEVLKKAIEPVAYLIIDVDLFKNVNDTYGHNIGDEVLKKIADLISSQFRDCDYVARIGGDEFAVLMTHLPEMARDVIEQKIIDLNELLQTSDDDIPVVTLSVGVAISQTGFKVEMEKQADIALYRVKNSGRCNCSIY